MNSQTIFNIVSKQINKIFRAFQCHLCLQPSLYNPTSKCCFGRTSWL